jgi:hypothetical protein
MLVEAVARVAFAQGGPPMITDDPGTPGNGNWENNLAIVFEHRHNETSIETPEIDLNYGVGEHIQLNLANHEFTETYILIISMGHELRSPDQPTALIGYFGMQFVY